MRASNGFRNQMAQLLRIYQLCSRSVQIFDRELRVAGLFSSLRTSTARPTRPERPYLESIGSIAFYERDGFIASHPQLPRKTSGY